MADEAGGPRILVVDDDATCRVLCRRVLLEVAPPGVAVDEAASAEEAAELVRKRTYGMVIADHHMARMSGIDLLQLVLREQPSCLRLLMTGRAQLELVKEALDRARIDAFLRKPPSAQEMREKLRALLAPPP